MKLATSSLAFLKFDEVFILMLNLSVYIYFDYYKKKKIFEDFLIYP